MSELKIVNLGHKENNFGGDGMTFKNLSELICYLKNLKEGDAYDTFRQSIINDLISHGYSEERANQVVDELERAIECKTKEDV